VGVQADPSVRRSLVLLTLGAALGVVVAAGGLIAPALNRHSSLPADAVARVNDVIIRSEDYERLLAAVAQDRRDSLDAEQRRRVLERLIDEELLVQRALQLGLARHDRKVRADLVAAVIASIVEEKQDLEPTEAELITFYEANQDFFRQPGRVRVRQIFFRVGEGRQAAAKLASAQKAARRLRAGEAFDRVRAEMGDDELLSLPDTLLPPAKLRDYVGPTALREIMSLEVGKISDPVRSGSGFHVLQVVERQPDSVPPLAEIRDQVVAELRRREGEKALRDYLAGLRETFDVEVRDSLP
jgi:parvulin-like peptidyl-prolyl isomerase